MKAVYIFLIYDALNAVKERDRRKEVLVTEALLDLDGGNILLVSMDSLNLSLLGL